MLGFGINKRFGLMKHTNVRSVAVRQLSSESLNSVLTLKNYNNIQDINYIQSCAKKHGVYKANRVQTWRSPECSRRIKLADFKTIGT
jgi:hypothetical protein